MAGATSEITDDGFEPARKVVSPGTTVVWKNVGTADYAICSGQFHDVTADWQFRTQTLLPGNGTVYAFDEKGIYENYCWSRGKDVCDVVLVGDVSLSDSLPRE